MSDDKPAGFTREELRKLEALANSPLPADAPCDPRDHIFAYVRWLEQIVMRLRDKIEGAGRH